MLYGGIHPNCTSSLLTVPVKIDGRQQHEETRSLLKTGTNVYTSGISSAVPLWKNLRSWVALCLIDIFIL